MLAISSKQMCYDVHVGQLTVADPGFPPVGAPTPRGAQTYDFAKFSRKPLEIERIWAPTRARIPAPPLRFANG